jgi:UDP-2-acetamido-3-amino-2,3-dideoxy-glucuronate N-acetyltransferase
MGIATHWRSKTKQNTTVSDLSYFAHPSAILDEGCSIGDGTKIWHFCHVMPGARIGKNSSLGQNVFVANGVTLGDNVKVQNNVSLYTGVECADDVFLGPSMVFTNVLNPRSAVERKNEYRETHVGRGASIGANATIVCGHDIGAFAFIGAGAVVTKNVPPYALIVGNPGRQIGWMSEHGERLHFDESGHATCPGSGERYLLKNNTVSKIS